MSEAIAINDKSDDWVLDDEGDVMLVVGSSDPCRIRVSSKILSLASDVFKAMFSPRFREGSNLRCVENPTAEPMVVALPEDHASAMLSLCQLLHYQTDMVDSSPDVTDLLALATICDKYNCARAVRYASHIWLSLLVESVGVGSLHRLLVASYLFDCAVMFTKATCRLLKEWTGSFKDLVRNHSIPESIYVTLEERSNDFHYHVERSLQAMFVNILDGKERCHRGYGTAGTAINRTTHVGMCVAAFIQIGLWPISRSSNISKILEQLDAFQWTPTATGCGARSCPACFVDFKPKMTQISADAVSQIKGLCLDCIHHDGDTPVLCRVCHGSPDFLELDYVGVFE